MGHQSSKLSTEPLPVEGSAGTTGTAGFNLREKGFAALRDSHIAREHDAERMDSDIDEDLAIMPLRLQDEDVASPLQLVNSDIKDLAESQIECRVQCMDGSCHVLAFGLGATTVADVLRSLHLRDAIPGGFPQLLLGQRILGHQQTWQELGVSSRDEPLEMQLVLLKPSLDVDFSDNSLGPAGMDALTAGFPEGGACGAQLRAVSLARIGLYGEEGGRMVARLLQAAPGLETLDLSGNNGFGAVSLLSSGLDVASIVLGMPSYSLHTLILADCSLDAPSGFALAALLSTFPNLKNFDIRSNNHLKAEGLRFFAEGFAQALRGLRCSIRRLDLGDTGLQNVNGGKAVARILRLMPQLAVLNLADNAGLGLDGFLAMGNELEHCSLVKLDLRKSGLPRDLDSRHFEGLLAKCPSIQLIDVDEKHSFHDWRSLQSVSCLRAARSDQADFASLHPQLINSSDSSELQQETLGFGGVSTLGTVELRAHFQLQSLCLDHSNLQTWTDGVALARLLGAMDLLENLSLYGNHDFGKHAFQAFVSSCPRHSNLRFLNLGECGLEGVDSGKALANIVGVLPGLSSLCVQKNHRLRNDGLHSFATVLCCCNLVALDLGCCSLMGRTGAVTVQCILEFMPALHTLSLSGNPQLQQAGLCLVLGEVLPDTNIRSLSLASCGFSPHDMDLQDLFRPRSPRLESLNLSGNTEMGALGLQTLLPQLPSSLQQLDLSDCGLESNAGGAVLSELLSNFRA